MTPDLLLSALVLGAFTLEALIHAYRVHREPKTLDAWISPELREMLRITESER